MLADMYLTGTLSDALAGADERRARRQRRLSALVEQCRRLRQRLHMAVAKLHDAQADYGARLLNLEAALRDITNEDECTNLHACQRRAKRALGER